MKKQLFFIVVIALCNLNEAIGQWATSGNNIYNTNTGNVGIGNNSPSTLLFVGKSMTEPTITVRNMGGTGGATYVMIDDASGANWKFKATLSGGFKLRDHTNLMDVITVEPNSFANAIYIKTTDNMGIGTATPDISALVDMTSTTKGFLPPRMTYSELLAIADPADGLIVFCTNCGSNGLGSISIYMAGGWYTLNANCLSPVAPSEGAHIPSDNQIIWNWEAVTAATGYKWNTVNDYATAEDLGTSTSKTETGLTPGTSYTRYAWASNACDHSPAATLNAITTFTCGNSISKTHVAGYVAPVTKSTTYGTVSNIPGEDSKCWITSNLGSDHQATSVDDATEASAGWYWQFNRQQGYKHDGAIRTPNTAWITWIGENSNWLIANDPCHIELGGEWRIPTASEYWNIDNAGGWFQSIHAFNSPLRLHQAGYLRDFDGYFLARGSEGDYYSSSQTADTQADRFWIWAAASSLNSGSKAGGYSLRCIKD